MKKNHRCSLQFHNKKHETVIVLKGKLRIHSGKNKTKLKSKIYKKYQSLIIPPNIHRMEAITDCLYLEASTPQLKDLVRLFLTTTIDNQDEKIKVCIPTAGLGKRLGNLTKFLNKSLVDIDLKPVISHIIDNFQKIQNLLYL